MSLSPKFKAVALAALSSHLGDDLYRAKHAFRNCTATEMGEKYGQSGKTRQEILAEYQRHHDDVTATIDAIKAL